MPSNKRDAILGTETGYPGESNGYLLVPAYSNKAKRCLYACAGLSKQRQESTLARRVKGLEDVDGSATLRTLTDFDPKFARVFSSVQRS
jgi:hypothetical protein